MDMHVGKAAGNTGILITRAGNVHTHTANAVACEGTMDIHIHASRLTPLLSIPYG